MQKQKAGEDKLRSTTEKSEIALREEEVLRYWQKHEIFKKSLEKEAPQGEFIFYDGPPFATGLPHHGSLLSSVIKDVVPRYKTMRGYRVPRRWGWDCHGLPIETEVEKKLGLKTKKDILTLGIDTFNETARSLVLRYVDEWEKYVDRIGRWVDFKNSYKTMDNSYIESVWWALATLYKKGLLYEGRKVLMYCTHCETPLAKAEIAMDNTYKDITEEAVTAKFKIKNPAKHGLPDSSYLLAWTTTPWTLPGNVALAVNPLVSYEVVREGNETMIRAGNGQMKGKDLVGVEYEPLFEVPALRSGKTYKVYGADFVTTQEGTGIVHTAVMYGEDDYMLGVANGLPTVQLLEPNGHYNEKAPEFLRGEYLRKGNKMIIEDLEKRNLLLKKEAHTHSYPHCYRCSTPLIYNAVPSWFINIQKVKRKMLSENEKVEWVPGHLKQGRFKHIVEQAPDWTISRNRFWASPLPIWKCKVCDKLEVVGSIDELQQRAGTYPKNAEGHLDLHRPYIDAIEFLCRCGGVMQRVPEVVDCWVESGAMPFASAGYPKDKSQIDPKGWFGFNTKRYPADFIAEYIAQTRTWFYYMHAMGVLLFNQLAFRSVVSTGTILAADGTKMSKSKGNYTDPLAVMDRFGADALRMHLMGSVVMQGEDLNFRDEDVREVHNRTLGILWNTYKFFELYQHQYDKVLKGEESPQILDRWIYSRLNKALIEVTRSLDAYDTPQACKEIKLLIDDYSTWYIRRSRDRARQGDTRDKQYALATQRHALITIAQLVSPIMPYIAESIYRGVRGERESVHLCEWPIPGAVDEQLLTDMERVRRLASQALQARERAGIKIRQPLGILKIKEALPPSLRQILAEEVNIKEVIEEPELAEEIQLDTTLTPELREEGLVREYVRAIQEWRKEQGLAIADRPGLLITTSVDAALLKKYREVFVAQTGLLSLEIKEVASPETVREFERL